MSQRNKPHHGLLNGPHRTSTHNTMPPLRLLLQGTSMKLELTSPTTLVGRHSTANVRLALPDVSRRHCRLEFIDGHWTVIDLNSLNGVFVNDQRMHESALYDGDRLRIGGLTFVVALDATDKFDEPGRTPHPKLQSIAELLPDPDETIAHRRNAA